MKQFILAFFGQSRVENMRTDNAIRSEYAQVLSEMRKAMSELRQLTTDTEQARDMGTAIRGDE